MNKKDLKNLLYLTLIQGTNAILPVVIYPYILLKIGSKLYSQVAIAENISLFILTFVLFGFEIDGVSMVVNHRKDAQPSHLSEVFCSIFYARILILSFCLFLILISSLFIHKQLLFLILGWALIPLGQILHNSYFYLGIENNFMNACCTIIGRIIGVILILTLIKTPSDFYKAPYIIGSTYLLGGFCSLMYILTKLKINFVKIPLNHTIQTLINSKEIFLGNLSTMLYRDSNLLILGIISADPITIAAYSVANKFINALQAVARPLNQLFFPKTIILLKNISKPCKQAFNIIFKTTIFQLIILLALVISLSLGLKLITHYSNILFLKFSPQKIERIVNYASIMVIAIFVGVSNFMFGSIGLNYLSEKKYYVGAMLLTGFISTISGFILAGCFSGIGASINFAMGETILLMFIIRKYFPRQQSELKY